PLRPALTCPSRTPVDFIRRSRPNRNSACPALWPPSGPSSICPAGMPGATGTTSHSSQFLDAPVFAPSSGPRRRLHRAHRLARPVDEFIEQLLALGGRELRC